MHATVFGLDVHSTTPLSFLRAAPAAPTGRTLELALAAADAPEPAWPASAQTVCDQPESDGTVSFRIETHPEAGYLIWGPAYGRHLLAADGRRVRCLPGNLATSAWQRLLIAQVLPFAALLQGLEVFHASAVVRERHAIAFVGPSRAGKTSLALELCRQGATFLADDVLALEQVGQELLGHPGTPVAGVDHVEATRREQAQSMGHTETLAINARERLINVTTAAEPAPLGALFFLDRRREAAGAPRFEPAPDALPLLAATFNFVLATPARLQRLLDVCALVAQRRVERIVIGPDVDASQLAVAVEQRLGGQS